MLLIWTFGNSTTLLAQDIYPFHFGIFYPLSTQGTSSKNNTNSFSLHALTGVSGGETAWGIYGLAGMVHGNVSGLQTAGLYHHTKGTLQGFQISGLLNRADTAAQGYQFAGLANLASGHTPVQIGGLFNRTTRITALQSAGIFNQARTAEGLQMAGLVNISEEITGVQVAGLTNTARHVNGLQISGLFNKAKTVNGVQLAGLLNIADSSAYSIAIINLIKDGTRRLGVSIDENQSLMLSFRSGGRKLYGLIGFGTNLQFPELAYGFESGLGGSLLQNRRINLDMEVHNMYMTDFSGSRYHKTGIRLLPTLNLGRSVQLYGGPGLYFIQSDKRHPSGQMDFWSVEKRNIRQSLSLSYTIGLQFFL